jgi:hypothetical protein
MRIVPNAGTDWVIDSVIPGLRPSAAIDGITPEPSQFAFGELREQLQRLAGARMVLPFEGTDLGLSGSSGARVARNQPTTRWLAGKVVLEDDGVWASIDDAADARWLRAFLDALALSRLLRTSMLTLYQGWIDTLVALVAARLTGTFSLLASAPEAGARRAATSDYERTEADIGRVRKLAARETQVSRQVELNQQLARLRATLSEARTKL